MNKLDPVADPDRDYLNNLLEYAMGSDPLNPEFDLIEAAVLNLESSLSLSLKYVQATSRIDVSLAALTSSDLASESWSSNAVTTKTIQSLGNRTHLRAQAQINLSAKTGFFRLQASQ